ncbi:signal peptidase I [Glutamicibacter sp. ZJUTW]|uniref:signal peptidase I n=1 Tax=Glutamicibacter sp. ZJUTW TaxID=1155384 RepID=UPI0011F0F201|nr:signal peptidase I [Glutamicibacter sp. ZJUTW]QEP08384.1 signal peptidase I [Glutamicibacter sp. ZJUTW]
MTAGNRIRNRGQQERTGIWWWCGQVLSWLVLFIVLALIAIMIVVPKLGGATAFTVLTGSMRPHLPPGTLVVVKPIDPEQLRIGDVATYQLESGEPEVVTHRVSAIGASLGRGAQFIFRGDANNTDDEPVQPEQIRGKLWYSVPYLGYVNSALSIQQRTWLTWIAAGGLIAYSLVMLAGAWHDHRREKASCRSTHR